MDVNRKKLSSASPKIRCECVPKAVDVKKHFNPSTGPVKLDWNLPEINWFYNPELNLLFHQFGHKMGPNGTENASTSSTDPSRGRKNSKWTRKSSLQISQPSSCSVRPSETYCRRRSSRNRSAPPYGVAKSDIKTNYGFKRALSAPGDKKMPPTPKVSPVGGARCKIKSPPARKGPPDKGQWNHNMQTYKKEVVLNKPSGAVFPKSTKCPNFVPTVTISPKTNARCSEKQETLAKLQEEIKHLKANNLKSFEEHIKDLKREISDFRKSDVAKKCNVDCPSKGSTVCSREKKVSEERVSSSKRERCRKGGTPASPCRVRSPPCKNHVDLRYALQHPTNQLENLFVAENCLAFESDSQEDTVLLNKIHEANELIEKVKDTLSVIKSKEYKKSTKEIQNNHPLPCVEFQQIHQLHQSFFHTPCSPPQPAKRVQLKQECVRPCTPLKCNRDSETDTPAPAPEPAPEECSKECPNKEEEETEARPKTRRPFTTTTAATSSSVCEKECNDELPSYSLIDKFLNAPGEYIEEDTSSTERLKQKLRTISEKSESEMSKTTMDNIESEVASEQKVDVVIESVRNSNEENTPRTLSTDKTEKTIQTCVECVDKAIGSDEECENVIVDSITEIRQLVERLLESVSELQGLDPTIEQDVFERLSSMIYKNDKDQKSNKNKFVESVVKDIVKDIVKQEVQEEKGQYKHDSCNSCAAELRDSCAATSITIIPCTDSAIEKAVNQLKTTCVNTDEYVVCACKSLSVTNFPPNTICCRSLKEMENIKEALEQDLEDDKGKPEEPPEQPPETNVDHESPLESSSNEPEEENSEDNDEEDKIEVDDKDILDNLEKFQIGDANEQVIDNKEDLVTALTDFNPSQANCLHTKKISNLSIQKLPCISISHPLQVRKVMNLYINENGRCMNSVPDGENVAYVEVVTKAKHKPTKFAKTRFNSKLDRTPTESSKHSSRFSDRDSSKDERKDVFSTTTIDSAGDSKKEDAESVTLTNSQLDESKSTINQPPSQTDEDGDLDDGKLETIASENYSMTYDSSPSPSSTSHRTKSTKRHSSKSMSGKSMSGKSMSGKSLSKKETLTTLCSDVSQKSSNQISSASFPPQKKYQLVEYGFLKHQQTQLSEGRRSMSRRGSARSSIVQRSEHSYAVIDEIPQKGDFLDQITTVSSFTNDFSESESKCSNYLSRTTIVKSKKGMRGGKTPAKCSAGDFPQSDSKEESRTTVMAPKDNMQGDASDFEVIMGNKTNTVSSSSMTNDISYLQGKKGRNFKPETKNESQQDMLKKETVTFDSKVEVRVEDSKEKASSQSSGKSKGREWYCSPFVNKYIKLSSNDKTSLSNKKGRKREKKKCPESVQAESVSCSEGEICKCDVSIGEVHNCNHSIMSVKNRLFPQSLGILKSNLKVEKHRTYFNNWVTYYINEGSRTFDPTTTASSSTDFKI